MEQEIRSGFAVVMVYVDNKNDNHPYFENEFYSADIAENSVSGSLIQIVRLLVDVSVLQSLDLTCR